MTAFYKQAELSEKLLKMPTLPAMKAFIVSEEIESLINEKLEVGLTLSDEESIFIDRRKSAKAKLSESESMQHPAGYAIALLIWAAICAVLIFATISAVGRYGFDSHDVRVFLYFSPFFILLSATTVGLWLKKTWARVPGLLCASVFLLLFPIGTITSIAVFRELNKSGSKLH